MTCRKNLFLSSNFMFKSFGKLSLYKTSDLSSDYFRNKVAFAFSYFFVTYGDVLVLRTTDTNNVSHAVIEI